MTDRRSALDRADRLTLAVTVVFLATLAIVAVVDETIGWLVWSVAMAVLVGTVLVLVARSESIE
ncbi:hypothetical protein [Halosolutus halophilus]|uniref:hypothetical protein n=1 Tax=Halosolutus halophilus TaxID=1552990 RepID=UPI0022350F54|nr:hypothetical protein [Halosolutus halophilus]